MYLPVRVLRYFRSCLSSIQCVSGLVLDRPVLINEAQILPVTVVLLPMSGPMRNIMPVPVFILPGPMPFLKGGKCNFIFVYCIDWSNLHVSDWDLSTICNLPVDWSVMIIKCVSVYM